MQHISTRLRLSNPVIGPDESIVEIFHLSIASPALRLTSRSHARAHMLKKIAPGQKSSLPQKGSGLSHWPGVTRALV